MSERDRIEIDFARAVRKAEELEQFAEHLLTLTRNGLNPALEMVAAGWSGDNAELFLKKCAGMEPNLLKISDELFKVAGNVRLTADIIYRAEKAALQLL